MGIMIYLVRLHVATDLTASYGHPYNNISVGKNM
jgi:hypothetical protein